MQIAIFALSAAVSMATSVILVSRLERVGERLGLSEALLGLLAALAADAPEITAAAAAIAGGHGTVGIGVTLGSNVFNVAAMLGISPLVAGRIALHRRSVLLEGFVGIWVALVALIVVAGLIGPIVGLVLALIAFIPYAGISAIHPENRPRMSMPLSWSAWLARALAEEELELSVAIRPRLGERLDVATVLGATIVVVVASIAMEQSAMELGTHAGLPAIVVGGLVLAGVTSLPNAVAAAYLAARGRGAATLSTAFNSNVLNVVIGLLVPAALLGLGARSDEALFVALSYVAITAWAIALAIRGRGLDRRAGAVIIARLFGLRRRARHSVAPGRPGGGDCSPSRLARTDRDGGPTGPPSLVLGIGERGTTSVDDDAERRDAARDRHRRRRKFSQGATVDGEDADGLRPGIDDVEMTAGRIEPSVEGPKARRALEGRAPKQRQAAVAGDPVARDRRARGVDREEVATVVADLDPARRGLVVGERRAVDRCERGVATDVIGGDAPSERAVVGVRHE